jgi:hypothetical protein
MNAKDRRALEAFRLFCDNLADVDLDPYENGDEDQKVYDSPYYQLMEANTIMGWAWCRLTAFATVMGPEWVEAVKFGYDANPVALDGLLRELDERLDEDGMDDSYKPTEPSDN